MNSRPIITIKEEAFKEEALAKIHSITRRNDFSVEQFTINDFTYQVIQSDPRFGVNGNRELHINATHIAADGSGKNVLRSVKTGIFACEQNIDLALKALENFLGRAITQHLAN